MPRAKRLSGISAGGISVSSGNFSNTDNNNLQKILEDFDKAISGKMQSTGTGRITVGAAPPPNPKYGDIWIDTN
jgi:hypothetical protein